MTNSSTGPLNAQSSLLWNPILGLESQLSQDSFFLYDEFDNLQKLGLHITELREKSEKNQEDWTLKTTLFEEQIDTLQKTLDFLKKVSDSTLPSNEKELLIQNIHEFILSYTDTDQANSKTTTNNKKVAEDFEETIKAFILKIDWVNKEDFSIPEEEEKIGRTLTNYDFRGIKGLLSFESLKELKIRSLCDIIKALLKKMVIGKTTISIQNLPLLSTFLLFIYRFNDFKSSNDLSAQKLFPATAPIWRELFSEVDLFIEEKESDPIFIEFLRRNSINESINKIPILQWLFFSDDNNRCTEDERSLIHHLDQERYKKLFFLKEKMAPYL
jgi:hypothetical protein